MWWILSVTVGLCFMAIGLWLKLHPARDLVAARGRARGRLAALAQRRHLSLPPPPDADLLVERTVRRVDGGRWVAFVALGLGFVAGGLMGHVDGGGFLNAWWFGMSVGVLGLMCSQMVHEDAARRSFAATRRVALLRREPRDAVLPRSVLLLEGISLAAVLAMLVAPAFNDGGAYEGVPADAVVVGVLWLVVGVVVVLFQLKMAATASALGTTEGLFWYALDRADIVAGWQPLLMTGAFGVMQALEDGIHPPHQVWKVVSLVPVALAVWGIVDIDGTRRRARIERQFLGTPA